MSEEKKERSTGKKIDGTKATAIIFLVTFILGAVSIGLSSGYQNGFGAIDVSIVTITDINGANLVGKLYRPVGVDAANPAPGILAIHGYNNDKDVQRPHSIELALRGFVVLAIDVGTHGDSDVSASALGGANEVYEWLQDQSYVDGEEMGIVGHSMGAYYAAYVGLSHPDHDAIAYQAFFPSAFFAGSLNNFLQIWSGLEEFTTRVSPWTGTVAEYYENGTYAIGQIVGLAPGTPGLADHTYGDFSDGSAQRFEYLDGTHPGQTHHLGGTQAIVAWFLQSLMNYSPEQAAESIALNGASSYLMSDFWGLVALISILISIIPLGLLLLKTPMFQIVAQPMPEFNERTHAKGPKWWIFATFNAALGALLYFFFTDNNWEAFDDGEGGLISGVFDNGWLKTVSNDVFNMAIANALVMFLIMAVVATLILYLVWWLLAGKKAGTTVADLGLTFGRKTRKESLEILVKIAGIVSILFFYLYAVVYAAMFLGQVELRGPWSMLKLMSLIRYQKFWVYFWPILIYWLVCGGMYMFGQMRQGDADKEWKTDLYWYLKICFMMLAGHGVLLMIAYFPPLFGWSAFPFIGNASWPMQILQLFGLIWGFMFLYFIAMFFFRKTGSIYLGSIISAVIGTWMIVTAGIFS